MEKNINLASRKASARVSRVRSCIRWKNEENINTPSVQIHIAVSVDANVAAGAAFLRTHDIISNANEVELRNSAAAQWLSFKPFALRNASNILSAR